MNMHLTNFLVFRGLTFSNFLLLKHRAPLNKLRKFGEALTPLVTWYKPSFQTYAFMERYVQKTYSPKYTKFTKCRARFRKRKKPHLLPFKCYDNRLFRNSIVLKVPWHCWIGVLYFPGTSVWNVLFYNHNHKEVFEYYFFLGTVDKLEQSLKMDGLGLEVTESAEHPLHTKIKSNSKIMFFRRLYFRNLLLKWYRLW